MRILPYNMQLKEFSQYLRNHSTLGEILLWQQLKNRQMHGFQFYRQKPLGKYIVDFYCPKLRLVIEVDGASHLAGENIAKDEIRQKVLEDMGLILMRYNDVDVKQNMAAVLISIDSFIVIPPK